MNISLFRAVAHEYHDLRRVGGVAMMNLISRLIEDQVLAQGLAVDLYTGFQRFSHVAAQADRYRRLAEVCRRITIFGVPDQPPPDLAGVRFVALDPDAALAREWFVVVDAPELWTALLAREVEPPAATGRRFDGIWTYEARVVERASLLLSQALGVEYDPAPQRNYERQSAQIAEISGRLLAELDGQRRAGRRRWVQLGTVQKIAEALARNRRTSALISEVAEIMRTLFGASSAAVALHLGRDRFLVAAAGAEAPQERVLGRSQGPSGEAFTRGRTVILADARRSRVLDPLVPGAQSLVAAPLRGRRRCYGVLTVGGASAGQWSAEDARTVAAVALLLAGGLDQRAEALDDASSRAEQPRAAESASVPGAAAQVAELRRTLQLLHSAGLTPTQRMALARAEQIAEQLGGPAPNSEHAD